MHAWLLRRGHSGLVAQMWLNILFRLSRVHDHNHDHHDDRRPMHKILLRCQHKGLVTQVWLNVLCWLSRVHSRTNNYQHANARVLRLEN